MKINIRGNVSDLTAIDCDLVCEHARSWDLDGIGPVVVVVAESVGEVKDGLLGYHGGVLGYVEMSWLNGALSH